MSECPSCGETHSVYDQEMHVMACHFRAWIENSVVASLKGIKDEIEARGIEDDIGLQHLIDTLPEEAETVEEQILEEHARPSEDSVKNSNGGENQ